MNRQRYARPKPAANNHHKAGGGPGRPFVGRGILEPLGRRAAALRVGATTRGARDNATFLVIAWSSRQPASVRRTNLIQND